MRIQYIMLYYQWGSAVKISHCAATVKSDRHNNFIYEHRKK